MILFSSLGIITSTFVGYCIYFDYKRTRAPDYRKKLRDRRLKQQEDTKSSSSQQQQMVIDLSNPVVRETFLKSEYEKGMTSLMENDTHNSINHFLNVLQLAPDPLKMISVFRQILPPDLFLEFMQQFQQLNAQTSHSVGDTRGLNESVALD